MVSKQKYPLFCVPWKKCIFCFFAVLIPEQITFIAPTRGRLKSNQIRLFPQTLQYNNMDRILLYLKDNLS